MALGKCSYYTRNWAGDGLGNSDKGKLMGCGKLSGSSAEKASIGPHFTQTTRLCIALGMETKYKCLFLPWWQQPRKERCQKPDRALIYLLSYFQRVYKSVHFWASLCVSGTHKRSGGKEKSKSMFMDLAWCNGAVMLEQEWPLLLHYFHKLGSVKLFKTLLYGEAFRILFTGT